MGLELCWFIVWIRKVKGLSGEKPTPYGGVYKTFLLVKLRITKADQLPYNVTVLFAK